MLEYISIATFGGLILWKWALNHDDLNELFGLASNVIQENVLQHRISELDKNFNIGADRSVKLIKTDRLLFVGIARNLMNSSQDYLSSLMKKMSLLFEHLQSNEEGNLGEKVPEVWEGAFETLIKESLNKSKQKQPKKFEDTKKGKEKYVGQKAPKKKGRKWDDSPLSQEESLALEANTANLNKGPRSVEKVSTEKIDLDSEWEQINAKKVEKEKKMNASGSWMSWLSGSKPLTKTDLEPVLLKFEQELMGKNVAAPVAKEICNQLLEKLEGTTPGLQFVSTHVRSALKEVLTRILTPKKHIDILRGIEVAKGERRPYSIVFVGVNGVGKSTNLSKVCCWLQQNQNKVLIAACDTFRTGAVEQLAVHATRLNAEVFERGYRTDPTQTAVAALEYASEKDHDVVLIDTAGRMQDNEPLMKALSKLVNTINPDLVLFVGEALVGNDAVDQLSKYNQALAELSSENPRLIDGIILSKFDTIDDKVGAAVSMVYTTGQPIVFLGVGQRYEDLRRMNVDMVTKSLLGI